MQLDFDENNNTYVIIGNNGTGKANIIEAISSVFAVLYGVMPRFEFSFRMLYKIADHVYRIAYDINNSTLSYKKDNVDISAAELLLPNRLICNYSGEYMRLWDSYYKEASLIHNKSVKASTLYDLLRMVYIDRTMWKYILLCMLCCKEHYDAFDNFLPEKLKLISLDTITLEFDEKELSKWKQENAITTYIAQVKARIEINNFQTSDPLDLNPSDDTPRDLFNKLVAADHVIENLSIIFNGGVECSLLSEGEKKMMVILFILEALSDEQTLVLMDETDSHIHIFRKAELKDMFAHMLNRENIITSHSPTLTNCFDKEAIIMLDKGQNGNIELINKDNIDLVSHLTEGKWNSQQQNIFLSSNKDILLVEGPTDVDYTTAALFFL